ncbi:MAG: prolyl-tRNA synthetase [Solirubrobacteraceae bacterium]|nr:prolyl-tRNA synthetase [Solirubrobacteraceae bacterium]
MARLSQALLPTERQDPADAEALSHKLMVRAGLIRQVGAGLWSWLPAGWRVHQNAVQIIREEMDAVGCQEMLMPVVTPAELWKRSGRYGISELFKLQDRRGAELILALSHEETLTFHIAAAVRSYRDLPKLIYHFQTKGRDEPRPRAGVLRTREFIMKDAYSFDRDEAGLDESYEKLAGAYDRIFDRSGLEWYSVESDVGMMGGTGAHEYMAPCPAGENDVALAPGFAANVEVASAEPQPVPPLPDAVSGELHTPGASTIEALAENLGVPAGNLLKAFPVVTAGRGLVLVFLRGDHRVQEIKLANALGEEYRPAEAEELAEKGLVGGFMGPREGVEVLYDAAVAPGRYVVGANRAEYHQVIEVEAGERSDIRCVEAGDTVDGKAIRIEPAIEIGNIFKLGTRYSEPLGATYLDENGSEQLIVMGSYGIGPARIAAAAVEQFADEQGISWPKSLAPWDVHLVVLGKGDTPERAAAERLYAELTEAGLGVVYDDTDRGTGEKLTVAELLGVPLRLVVGKRSLESGTIEAQGRRGSVDLEPVAVEGAAGAVAELWRSLP